MKERKKERKRERKRERKKAVPGEAKKIMSAHLSEL